MTLPRLLIVLCALLGNPFDAAAQFKPPTRESPPPSTEKHTALIKEGIALHVKGDYDGALAKYNAVLAESPDDLLALYEIVVTMAARKDYAKALEVAARGADYKSEHIGPFYNMIGNVYVLMQQPETAIRAFEYGIGLDPTEAQLHYNVSVSYAQAKRNADALRSLKTAVVLRPDYGSAHFNLAVMFLGGGYPVPAMLAFERYLTLDPQSQRSTTALSMLNSILRDTSQQSRGGGPRSPVPSGKTDEGNFTSVETLIYAGRPLRTRDQIQATSEIRLLVDQMTTMIRSLGSPPASERGSSFTTAYYVPYFVQMQERKLVEPFVYHIFRRANLPGAAEWLAANPEAVKAFLAWSAQYKWSKPDVR
jgi:tetratricopeptide (TPR) repeat protein